MSVIQPTVTALGGAGNHHCRLVVWAGVTSADTCAAFEGSDFSDRSVQIEGTFASATVVLKGSNDGTNYQNLTDPQGNAISKSAACWIQHWW